MRAALGLFLVFLTVTSESPLVAAPEDAEAMVRRGLELRKQGKDREALAEFERARALGETPRLLAQIGLAQFALGQWVLAEEQLTRALAREHQDDLWIKRNHNALVAALDNVGGHLGSVEVWGEPAGAEVLVNGKRAGVLPSPPAVRVVAGPCSIAARADGYEETARSVNVPPKGRVREYLQLVRQSPARSRAVVADEPATSAARASAAPSLPAARAPTEGPEAETRAGLASAAPPDGGSGGIATRWWFWTVLGVVAAGAVAAYVVTRPGPGLSCPRTAECPP